MKKIYEFKKEDAYSFANHVNGRCREKGNELVFMSCPYCKGGKNRDKNTFSINVNTGQFECKRSSCSARGNMISLSRDFGFTLSEELDRYYNINDYNGKFKKFKESHIQSKDGAIRYLSERGISEDICRKYEITTKEGQDNVLVFPFKNESGELKFIKYRNLDFVKGQSAGSKEWCEAQCMPILFGMNHCEDFTELVVTEGQIDSLSLAEVGIKNTVSVPTGKNGFTWIPHCWDWLIQFESLVVFGDNENGEITLSETLSKRFPHKVRVVNPEDYKGCKDANEILRNYGSQALIDAVVSAKEVPNKQIKSLADVEAVDILNSEAIKTNIDTLDNILSGGMHLGQLILLSGERGDGKSTFMSQLIVEATQQGYVSFVYSGELMDYYFKRWIDMQIAGKRELTNPTINKLNDWYRNKIYLYDNNVVEDEEMEELLTVVETAIQKYGAKFICIDNLMTAMEVDPREDLYRAQSRFVGRLAKIAKTHNVVVLLVAHPRKSNSDFSNDVISGSADITNKVDIVMGYCRDSDYADYMRTLVVTKNRLTGKLARPGDLILDYSDDSKRIVEHGCGFNKNYGWCDTVEAENDNDGFIKVPEDAEWEIPF